LTRKVAVDGSMVTNEALDHNGRGGEELREPSYLRTKSLTLPSSFPANRIPLSKREGEVLRLVAEGKRNKEIAPLMNISIKTVETYRSRIMLKLDLHSVAHLVRYAVRNRLVDL